MPGGGDDGHSEQRPAVELRPRVLESAAAARERERAPLRNEDLLHLDVLAAGADHAHRVPRVDDLVLALRHHAEAPIHWGFTGRRLAVLAVDRDREHVPVAVVDAGREWPSAADDEPIIDFFPSAGGQGNGRRDQYVRIRVPHLVLRLWLVVAEDPVVAAEVADVPGGGGAAARELRHDIDDRLERQLHAAEAPGLVEAEQARLVQQLLVLGQKHARVLALLRALEERRHALARAAHRLFVADAGEAHFRKSSTSRRGGSSATAISFSIARPHPGQQNWRNRGCGSMKRFGSPTIGFDASIGRSVRTQPSL